MNRSMIEKHSSRTSKNSFRKTYHRWYQKFLLRIHKNNLSQRWCKQSSWGMSPICQSGRKLKKTRRQKRSANFAARCLPVGVPWLAIETQSMIIWKTHRKPSIAPISKLSPSLNRKFKHFLLLLRLSSSLHSSSVKFWRESPSPNIRRGKKGSSNKCLGRRPCSSHKVFRHHNSAPSYHSKYHPLK